MSNRQVQNPWLTDVFTTASNILTASTNATFAPPSGSSGYVEMVATARNTASGAAGIVKVGQSWKNVAGTVTMTGTPTLLVNGTSSDAGMTTILASFAGTTATTIIPAVTGVLTTSIEWLLDVRYWVN